MTIQFFAPRCWDGSIMRLPNAYRKKVRWLPEIGDIFPNFHLESTHGPIEFWDWAEGSWTYLFSHPAARTPVCTTELGSIAANGEDFAALGVNALGLSGSSIAEQQLWHREVMDLYGHDVWFPTGQDASGQLLDLFGACHAHEAEAFPIRKSFVLDPQMRIRMIIEYPMQIGRNVEEILRVFEALQVCEETRAATPADWNQGDPLILPDYRSEEDVIRVFGTTSKHLLSYLRIVDGFRRSSIAPLWPSNN
ncbi:redoxin domain-containing protein [Maritimibacter sp. UBA3975]|uniref:redoxin domain-containing protein n=1 Tax=Maritimibacter sp. UBA3975 TaxID=1946833 RepID=UPI000C099CAF|nr:redoxin domain-containing protein [Maritimibacter sp. UBA3975]MAM62355.1 peroxiredoxin [Maritimibacter sp.]|tara:strand:- start:14588 stop:15337 length:750 start_codon:yes stop_codon:yes gene_type:complete